MTNPTGLSASPRRRGAHWRAITIGAFALPPIFDLLLSDKRASFHYLAADSFYYLTVARNLVELGSPTFDEVHLTNGFHPLWQALLTGLFAAGRSVGAAESVLLSATVVLGVLLISAGIFALARAFSDEDGRLPLLFMTLPVGLYGFAISPLWWWLDAEELFQQNRLEGSQPLYGSLWSYANGMESSALLLMVGLLFAWYVAKPVSERIGSAAVFGVLLAFTTFARLDHVYLPLALLLMLAARCLLRSRRDEWLAWSSMAAIFGLLLGGYMLASQWVFGSPVPVSGALKSTFPHVTNSFPRLVAKLWNEAGTGEPWLYLAWRFTQITFPVVMAFVFLFWVFRRSDGRRPLRLEQQRRTERLDFLLTATALSVVVLAFSNGLFVRWGQQGHWYFPLSVLFFGLALIRMLDERSWLRRLEAAPKARRWVVAALVALTLLTFVGLQRQPAYHVRYSEFYFDEAPRLRAFYGRERPRLLSYDDGIVAFATGFPTMSGIGLALDIDAIPHVRNGALANLAVQRGYDRFTSLVYIDMRELSRPGVSSDQIARWIPNKFGGLKAPDRYRFEVEYRSADGRFVIVRVGPRTEG